MIVDVPAPEVEKGAVKLKTYEGVDIYVTTTGRFQATYTRLGERNPDTYSRGKLDDLEADIHKNQLGAAARRSVEVRYVPPNPISSNDLDTLAKMVVNKTPYKYTHTVGRVVINGVMRQARDSRGQGGAVLFATTTGTAPMNGTWTPPNDTLDAGYVALITEYLAVERDWYARFATYLTLYPVLTTEDIIEALRKQEATE